MKPKTAVFSSETPTYGLQRKASVSYTTTTTTTTYISTELLVTGVKRFAGYWHCISVPFNGR
jgi:hypothetical protein